MKEVILVLDKKFFEKIESWFKGNQYVTRKDVLKMTARSSYYSIYKPRILELNKILKEATGQEFISFEQRRDPVTGEMVQVLKRDISIKLKQTHFSTTLIVISH